MIGEIAVICVSWNDTPDLMEAVASLARARAKRLDDRPRVRLVIVGNGGSVALPRAEIEALWPGAIVLENPTNRGLGPASNQAAALVESEVLLFVNPDTRAEGEPFTPIARAFASDANVVAVAPRLIEMDGRVPAAGRLRLSLPGREDQATFQLRRLPSLRADARELLLLDHLAPDNPGRRRSRYADADRGSSFPVEQAAAAALAVRRSAFQAVGGFDEAFVPAWYEDVDLCERLGRRGRLLYLPGAEFRHRGGDSASRLGYERFLPIFYRNALRYRRTRYGLTARIAYRGLLAGGMLLRLALLPLRRDVPRSRSEAARAYWGVLSLAAGLGTNRPSPMTTRQAP